MRILVIGAGAIGGSLAAYLTKTSANVTLLELNPDTCNYISVNGITVVDGENTITADVKIVNSTSELEERSFDCCFTATRAYNMSAAVTSILPYLTPDALVIAMNNGVCIDTLAGIVGKDHAVGGMINYGVGISHVGSYYIKIRGGLVLGMLLESGSGIPKNLVRLSELLNQVIPTTVTDNIVGSLYSKMLINACITSSALISGLLLGDILRSKSGRALFTAIAAEGVAVANAANIEIPKYNGKLNYYSLIKNDILHRIMRRITYLVMANRYSKRTSASLEALRNGVKTETDYFNGYISRLGRKLNVPTPANDKMCSMIKRIEKDVSFISPNNLNLLGF